MTRQPKRASQAWKTVVLAAGCLVAAGSVALGPRALAQSAQPGAAPSTPASAEIFEKASIIPSRAVGTTRVQHAARPVQATNVSVRSLIRFAYQVQDFQIVGAPRWIRLRSLRYRRDAGDRSDTAAWRRSAAPRARARVAGRPIQVEGRSRNQGPSTVRAGRGAPRWQTGRANAPFEYRLRGTGAELRTGKPGSWYAAPARPDALWRSDVARHAHSRRGHGRGIRHEPVAADGPRRREQDGADRHL